MSQILAAVAKRRQSVTAAPYNDPVKDLTVQINALKKQLLQLEAERQALLNPPPKLKKFMGLKVVLDALKDKAKYSKLSVYLQDTIPHAKFDNLQAMVLELHDMSLNDDPSSKFLSKTPVNRRRMKLLFNKITIFMRDYLELSDTDRQRLPNDCLVKLGYATVGTPYLVTNI